MNVADMGYVSAAFEAALDLDTWLMSEDLMKLARIACTILAGLSSPAWAVCGTNNCPDVIVQRIYPNTDGRTYVKIDASLTPLNCTPLTGGYLTLQRSDTNSDWIFATILTAITANGGKLENIRIVEGTSGCVIAYVWQKPQS